MTTEHEIDFPDDTDPDDLSISELDRLTAVSDYSIDMIISHLEGRIRNPDHEKVRQRYLGLLSTHIRTRLFVREQPKIDDLADEIEELRAELEVEAER